MGRLALMAGMMFLLVVGAAGGAPPTGSGGKWLAPTVIDKSNDRYPSNIAIARGGAAVAISGSGGLTHVTTRPTGGRWGAPVTLGIYDIPAGHYMCWASKLLALDASGGAVVACDHYEQSKYPQEESVVAYERTGSTGAFRGPVTVSQQMWNFSDLALDADDAGDAVVAWIGIDHYGDLQVARAAFRHADGTWEAPQNLGYAGSSYFIATSPSVALDAHGDALMVWTGGPLGPVNGTLTSQSTVYAESRPAGAGWGPAVVLSQRAIDDGNATVAMNRKGDALAVWSELDETGHSVLVSSFRDAGASAWTTTSRVPVTRPIEDAETGSFALDEAGNATLVSISSTGDIEVATHAEAASSWSGPTLLGNAGTSAVLCVRPRIAVDQEGDAVVIWGGAALNATRRSVGSPTWEKSVVLASPPACGALDLATDQAGDGVAVWGRKGTGLQSSTLDVTPPVLTKFRVPKTAPAGRQVQFAVMPTDLWSSVRPPLWRFGDGATAQGVTVRHTFRMSGRFRVSVIVSDQAQNTTKSAATLHVTGPR